MFLRMSKKCCAKDWKQDVKSSELRLGMVLGGAYGWEENKRRGKTERDSLEKLSNFVYFIEELGGFF